MKLIRSSTAFRFSTFTVIESNRPEHGSELPRLTGSGKGPPSSLRMTFINAAIPDGQSTAPWHHGRIDGPHAFPCGHAMRASYHTCRARLPRGPGKFLRLSRTRSQTPPPLLCFPVPPPRPAPCSASRLIPAQYSHNKEPVPG
jgi:hypothetical protein